MSFYGNQGGSNSPYQAPPQYRTFTGPGANYGTSTPSKNQLIQSIFVAYPNSARPVKNDNSVIDVALSLRNNNQVTFRIILGQNFPLQAPTIRLLARCAPYTYLEPSTSNVIHASLQRWDPNCNLGSLCKQIFNQFVNYPPTVLQNNVDPTATMTHSPQPSPSYGSNTGASLSSMPRTTYSNIPSNPPPKVNVNVPPIPKKFREIDSMSKEEVDELLNSKPHLENFVERLEYYQDLAAKVESLRTENVNVAKRNKEREYEIKKKTDILNEKKVEIQKLSGIVQDVNNKRMEIQQRYQPKQIVKMLGDLMFEGEKTFGKKSERFSEEGGSVDQFIRDMKKARQLYHIRKLKKEGFEKRYATQM